MKPGVAPTLLVAFAACASDGGEPKAPLADASAPKTPTPLVRAPRESPESRASGGDHARDREPVGCPDAYGSIDCRRPGISVDILGATPCCGVYTRDALCCAAVGQPCSDELGEKCCGTLRCGPRCVCE